MTVLLRFALENLLFIGLHLDGRNSFPKQLSRKEEEECIKKIAQGDTNAREKLIEHNLRLVAYIVNKNFPDARDQDDLISIGTIGLIRAAETFDYQKGTHFSTYASRCIDNAITHLRKQYPLYRRCLFSRCIIGITAISSRLCRQEKYGLVLRPILSCQ